MPRTPKTPRNTIRQLSDPLLESDAPVDSADLGAMELPDEEMNQFGQEDNLLQESGDMRGFDAPPQMPATATNGKKARSPVIGSLSFLQVDLPLITLDAFQTWLLDANHDQLPNPIGGEPIPYKSLFRAQVESGEYSEAYAEFLLDAIGRDMDADADRPLTERHYNQEAWLGKSFRSTLAQYQAAQVQSAVEQALGQYKHSALERFQAQWPDLPVDQLHYLLDIPTI